MAFYTAVDEVALRELLARYGLVDLQVYEGASDGIENSTYLLQADGKPWVLTLFEELPAADLPFFVRLMEHLHQHGLPVACPELDHGGAALQQLSGKPALLFPRLPGSHPRSTSVAQCRVIGQFLGRMHSITQHHPEQRDNARGTDWMRELQQRLAAGLPHEQVVLLAEQIANAGRLRSMDLPTGVIHGDLFHDNALFDGEALSGVIDFYNACTDILLLDLAIAVNDWCALPEGGLDAQRVAALTEAYCAERPVLSAEREQWQAVLQLGASRFWLSRLLVEKQPTRPGLSHPHKPSAEYLARLCYHRHNKIPI